MIKSMLFCHRSCVLTSNPAGLSLAVSTSKIPSDFACNHRFLHLNTISRRLQRNLAVRSSIEPGVPLPSGPPPGSCWKGWILGIVFTAVLPFLTNKWGPLLKLKNEVDTVVETAENVAEVVEKVAEQVEKVAEEISEDLPAGNLKNAASVVERLAEETADTAELVGDFIDKVQEVEEKVEKFAESIADEETETSKEAKEASARDEPKQSTEEAKQSTEEAKQAREQATP